MTKLWLVRLGKFGEQETHAIETGELVTGWELSDFRSAASREEILVVLQTDYPDEKLGTLQNWAAQLNQLKNLAAEGDLVVLPMKTSGQLAIGRIVGGFTQTPAGNPVRKVNWLRTDLPRGAVKQDLLYSLGASQTVCEISRNEAAARLLAAANSGVDPGPQLAGKGTAPRPNAAPDSEGDVAGVNLGDLARDQIEQHIAAHFAGHAFTQLIAAILRAQGYQTTVSAPGADRGVDIVAGQGALGFGAPKLVVQVKSGDIVTDQPTLQGLIGCVEDTRADHGLLVSWSGFTPPVRKRINDLFFRVRLWGRDEILDALFSVYDLLPETIRTELPLRRIWSLVPEDSSAS